MAVIIALSSGAFSWGMLQRLLDIVSTYLPAVQ